MSQSRSPAEITAGTTQDDAPTLKPTMTMAATHATANGADGELLEYDQYAAAISCATDTIARVVEADSR